MPHESHIVDLLVADYLSGRVSLAGLLDGIEGGAA